jgi:hypothetical protein
VPYMSGKKVIEAKKKAEKSDKKGKK